MEGGRFVDGRMEEWKFVDGRMEGWKFVRDGRMEWPFSASVEKGTASCLRLPFGAWT